VYLQGEKMLIQVDADGRKAVEALCDMALRVGGLKNLQLVTTILGLGLKDIVEVKQATPPAPEE